MVSSKECKSCHITKLLSEFSRQKLGKFGRRSKCKICIKQKEYEPNKHYIMEQHKKYYKANSEKLKEKWQKHYNKCKCYYILKRIKHRCNNEKDSHYYCYGQKGIKCLITLEEIQRLWKRDKASNMRVPSIDRKEVDKSYTFENCRFIEHSENTGRNKRIPTGQYDENGNLIKIYKSQREASKAIGVSFQELNRILNHRNNKLYAGYYWKKEKKDAIINL